VSSTTLIRKRCRSSVVSSTTLIRKRCRYDKYDKERFGNDELMNGLSKFAFYGRVELVRTDSGLSRHLRRYPMSS
jgi:hypothetical protein